MVTPSPLLDWLYEFDIGNPEKQGAIIIFPRMIDRWNIASIIVSTWDRFRVVIVTDHPDDFMQTIIDSDQPPLSIDQKHFNRIAFPLIKYSHLDEINKALHNTEIDIILFDDARMLATIAPGLNFNSIKPRIIVLTSWGDTEKQLDIITSNLPSLRLLSIDLISDTSTIHWKHIVIPMTVRQFYYYSEVRNREINHSRESAGSFQIPYPMSRMITLYTYPESIMIDTLSHHSICETDQTSNPDRLTNQSWLNSDFLSTINEDGPKLAALLDGIVSHWPAKQIVLTRFNHRYGVDLITSMLRLLTESQQNPYEMDEIYHIACTDAYEDTVNSLHKFNQSTSGLLITNIIPLIPIHNVSIIQVVDSYSFPTLIALIDRCHKRYLNQSHQDLMIYSYIASMPKTLNDTTPIESKSSDEYLYETLIHEITLSNRIYNGLIKQSRRIVYDSEHGVLVI